MSAHLLRQLIREQIEGLLLEAATFEPYQVQSIDDIDVQKVRVNALQTGFIHPVFIAESLEAAQEFNQGESSQRWSRLYTGVDGLDRVLMGISQVKFQDGDWVVIPALFGKDRTYGGLMRIRAQDLLNIDDENILKRLKNDGVISESLEVVSIPFVLLKDNKQIARMFIHKITGKTKSLEEAKESLDFWLDRRNAAQEKERAAAERAAKRAEKGETAGSRGTSRSAAAAPPPPPSKPASPWAKLDRDRAEKKAKK